MKSQNIAKINPIIDITSPVLLQCKSGECGSCPNNTGKMLWILGEISNIAFNFRYNFFDKSAESTSSIRYNLATGTINGSSVSYSNRPDKAWAIANTTITSSPNLTPSSMSGYSTLSHSFAVPSSGGWLFFRQPNPAISNIHDALCFEYNHERRLITFRSF